jgi:hypothetical protein
MAQPPFVGKFYAARVVLDEADASPRGIVVMRAPVVGEIVLPPPLIAGTLDDLSTRGSF